MAMRKRKGDDGYRSAWHISGASMADLPEGIFFDIILKLSTWSIVMCKCVCKSWHDLLSDPQFAKLHFAQAKPCPLIRNSKQPCFAGALYLLEPEDGGDYDVGYCWCDTCNLCRRHVKVKSMLVPPGVYHSVYSGLWFRSDFDMFIGTRSNISSCEGLLCLSQSAERVVVGNPITGEFILLPRPRSMNIKDHDKTVICFGFGPKRYQYKVLILLHGNGDIDSRIHTLGESAWRSLGVFPLKWHLKRGDSPVCFNGILHWFCSDDGRSQSRHLGCFDLDEERARSSIQLPLCEEKNNYLGLGVLGGRLCSYERFPLLGFNIWAMEEYGIAESWTRLVSVHENSTISTYFCKPLRQLMNGDILLFENESNKLIYCDEAGELRFKRVKCPNATKFVAIAHTPSFVSLKDMVNTTRVDVLNVYSRCGRKRLAEEARPVYIGSGKSCAAWTLLILCNVLIIFFFLFLFTCLFK